MYYEIFVNTELSFSHRHRFSYLIVLLFVSELIISRVCILLDTILLKMMRHVRRNVPIIGEDGPHVQLGEISFYGFRHPLALVRFSSKSDVWWINSSP